MPVIVLELELELGPVYKPGGDFDFAGQVLWRLPAPGGKTLAPNPKTETDLTADYTDRIGYDCQCAEVFPRKDSYVPPPITPKSVKSAESAVLILEFRLKRRRRARIKAWGGAKRNPREQLIVDQALKERLMLGVGGPFSSSALELFQSSGTWCGPFLGFRFTPPQASEAFAPPAHPLSQY